jgi:hypothetical protein
LALKQLVEGGKGPVAFFTTSRRQISSEMPRREPSIVWKSWFHRDRATGSTTRIGIAGAYLHHGADNDILLQPYLASFVSVSVSVSSSLSAGTNADFTMIPAAGRAADKLTAPFPLCAPLSP